MASWSPANVSLVRPDSTLTVRVESGHARLGKCSMCDDQFSIIIYIREGPCFQIMIILNTE